MKKIVFLVAFVFVLAAGEIYACSCVAPTTDDLPTLVKKAFQESKAVFSAQAIEVKRNEASSYVEVKLRVRQSWKNRLPKTVVLRTALDSAACGYSFAVGKSYLIYASQDEDVLQTNICTRTNSLAAARKETAVLNKLRRRKG